MSGNSTKQWTRKNTRQEETTNEMKCLYGIGRAAEDSETVDEFIGRAVRLVRDTMPSPEESSARITLGETIYESPDFRTYPHHSAAELAAGGEAIGRVEIFSGRDSQCFKEGDYAIKVLAGKISGAVRRIELEQVQEKLIRAERLAAVGEMASGVGHELRNPLNVIRNCAYLLKMTLTGKDAEALKTVAVLDKQVDVANKIITDLLDFTRITPPVPVRVDLKTLINECLSWITIPSQVTVKTNFNGAAPVTTDPEQISRVFANIISNAIQAMNNGGGELTIETGEEGDMVWVRFRDTGYGIAAANLDRIFEPLFTTKHKGIGLGLAISKRLVEENGGRIDVYSREGQGATFTVTLPLEKRS
jgi:signal transduction histidine kinase